MRPFSALLSYVSAPGTRPVATSLTTLRHAASTLRAMASSANEEADLHVATSSGLPPVFRKELESTDCLAQGEEDWDQEDKAEFEELERWSAELQRSKAEWELERLELQRSEQALQQALDKQNKLCRQMLQEKWQALEVLEEQHKSREMQMKELHRIFVYPIWINELCFRAAERIKSAAQKDGQHGSAEPPAGGNPWDCSVPGWAAAWLKDSGDSVNLEEMDLTKIFSVVPLAHKYGQYSWSDRIEDEAVKIQAAAVHDMADKPDGASLARIFAFVYGFSADTV